MSRHILMSVAALGLLAGCQQANAPEAPPADAEAVLAAISEIEQGQLAALNAHDASGATNVYTADARFFDAGSPPAVGAEAIAAGFDAMVKDPNTAITLTRQAGWVSQSGDLAVTVADYRFTYSGEDGAPVTVNGVNQSVWQKQEDGGWKMVADFNGATGDPVPGAAEATAQ
jgi:uncharacterized protein (TIGR02246 family)